MIILVNLLYVTEVAKSEIAAYTHNFRHSFPYILEETSINRTFFVFVLEKKYMEIRKKKYKMKMKNGIKHF